MIAMLSGKIELITARFVVLDVSGVGYKVYCGSNTLKRIGEKGQEGKLFVHLYPRENLLDLYGFLTFEELEFFEQLISVSGIGPKAGLSVMALASVKNLKKAIASGQKNLLTKVSGIGQKTAERIILELKSKIFAPVSDIKELSADSEAIDALVSLGYSGQQAREAIKKIAANIKGTEEKIKEALKVLGQ